MSFIKRGIRIYLYGSIHIACMGFLSFWASNFFECISYEIGLSIGISIFIIYNVLRILRIKNYDCIAANPHLRWVSNNLTEILFALGFSILILGLILWRIHCQINTQVLFSILILTTSYPFLRKILLIKNIIIALSWTLLYSLFTLHPFPNQKTIYLNLFLFIYFLGLSIWYDRKDFEENQGKDWTYLFFIDSLIPVPFLILYFLRNS